MSPKDFIDGYINERRRRFQDQPANAILQLIYTGVKIVVGLVFLWFVKSAGGVVLDHKPMKEVQAKQTLVLEKLCDTQALHTTDIRVLQEKTDNMKERLGLIERKINNR